MRHSARMRRALSMILLLTGCGGESAPPPLPPRDGLGTACSSTTGCAGALLCFIGERWGDTCAAYCGRDKNLAQTCPSPAERCIPRIGDEPGAAGICLRDCAAGCGTLRCDAGFGVCVRP